MKTTLSEKSTLAEIRQRFDQDVERFANLQTGQQSTVDAPISLELITEAALFANPNARNLLDIGCGAGNYTLKMLEKLPDLACTLLDISLPMLQRAEERVRAATNQEVTIVQSDILSAALGEKTYDIILAGAVLHHLRAEEEWKAVFTKLFKALKPGGSLWISDLIVHDAPMINQMMWQQYGRYLEGIGGEANREKVLSYVDQEDSPRSLGYQTKLLQEVGFKQIEILHKNLCFAAFGAIKS